VLVVGFGKRAADLSYTCARSVGLFFFPVIFCGIFSKGNVFIVTQ
jgi:hypothetical protein